MVEGRASRRTDPTRKPYPELRSWLLDTAAAFREDVLPLFSDGGVVLTSATLATGSAQRRSFDYPRRRLGLEGGPEGRGGGRAVREYAGGEVFDYGKRCLIYTETELPAPGASGAEGYARSCAERTRELVGHSGGRALVILSTWKAVEVFRECFKPPYPVRYQGDDSPGRLIGWLKKTDGAVLVGTRGMGEGVDVPGASVSMVVMDKVPFPPPDDPVIAALTERAGKAWFKEVSLPKAQTAVRQGSGRLLRRSTDRGVVALLDSRTTEKSWGKAVLSAMPDAPRTSSLDDVGRFFEAESAEEVGLSPGGAGGGAGGSSGSGAGGG